MMRFDPKAEVLCDDCGDCEMWEAEFVYYDFSGNGGHYDFSDAAFRNWCLREGWSEKDDRTFCPQCTIASTPPETE